MAKILYSQPVREKIKEELGEKIKRLERQPVLAIVQSGNREDSSIYIKQKLKFGEEIGVQVRFKDLKIEKLKDRGEGGIIEEIKRLNEDKEVDGIIVQLPLPDGFDKEKVLESILISKDADGLVSGSKTIPATARAILKLLEYYEIEVRDKKVAIIGRSLLVGRPTAELLREKGALVSVCHRQTANMAEICRGSHILISAAGQAGLVTKDFVHPNQVVIDVGINTPPPASQWTSPTLGEVGQTNITGPRKLVGDVNFAEVEPIVASITPVPGGIGPLTVACLFENLLDLCYNAEN